MNRGLNVIWSHVRVKFHIDYKILPLTFKALNTLAPAYSPYQLMQS